MRVFSTIHMNRKSKVGILFFVPFFILFFLFTILPVLSSIGLSFTNYNMFQPAEFAGLNNYRLLLMEDDIFLIALKNTLVFAVISGPIGFLMSFIFAWVINSLRFKRGFALLFYAPSLTSSIALSVTWLYFFSSDRYGFINNLLLKMGLIQNPIYWVSDPKTIMPVIIVISVWMSMGTGFLVFLAGFQNLPQEVLEASEIDGVPNKAAQLYYIVLPMMKQQLLFGAINAIVGAFGVYDIAVSVAGMPSPEYAGHTIVAHLYDYAFIRFKMGYASAIAVFLFAFTFVLGQICMRVFKSND